MAKKDEKKTSLRERMLEMKDGLKAEVLSSSSYFDKGEPFKFSIPILNVASSGSLEGGRYPGFRIIAAPPKTFKTVFCLIEVADFLREFEDGIVLYYDCERGTNTEAILNHGIDPDRFLPIPFSNIEELRNDVFRRITDINKGEKVLIVVDSIGQVTSKKQADDALAGENKQNIKASMDKREMFRLWGPVVAQKDIYVTIIGHVYDEIGAYVPTKKLAGGEGSKYSANVVWIVTKSREKDGKEVVGNNFTITVDFSRHVVERATFIVNASYEDGVDKNSGLFALATEFGYIKQSGAGWYTIPSSENPDQKMRESDITESSFLLDLCENESFQKDVRCKYSILKK